MTRQEQQQQQRPLHKPWQFDWKRPLWQRLAAADDDDDESQQKPSDTEQVVHHSAAAMTDKELRQVLVASRTATDEEEDNIDAFSFVLTVTLLSSSSSSSESTTGDTIMLELVEQQPTRAARAVEDEDDDCDDMGDNENIEQDGNDSDSLGLCPVRRMSRRLEWPSIFHNRSDASSLASCCFCRPPRHDASSSANHAKSLLELLSLGGSAEAESSTIQEAAILSTESNTSPLPPQQQQGEVGHHQDDDDNPSPLLLACLTTAGQVYIYDACRLLQGDSATDYKNAAPVAVADQDPWQHSMESLLFGRDVLQAVTTKILPLCQPLQTISLLSLSWHRHTNRRRRRALATTAEEHEEEENVNNMEDDDAAAAAAARQDDIESRRISVWDSSLWDSTTDLASLPFATKQNRPTHCVAAFDYLVVAGNGRRRKRYRRKRLMPGAQGVTNTTMSSGASVGAISEGATSVASGTTLTTVNTINRQLSQHADNGGFVSFLSLHNFSQERTVYLPFVPRDVSPFCWGGMQFLLVLGHTATEALAIRMDAAVNSSTVTSGEAPTMDLAVTTASSRHVESAESDETPKKRVVPIRRFQMIPIQMPDVQDLSPLVVGSSAMTVPPALVMLFVEEHEGHVSVLQRTLHSMEFASCDEFCSLYELYQIEGANTGELAVITTEQYDAHVAHMTLPSSVSLDVGSVWCCLRQGWCVVGIASLRYFVCWEGATALQGAYICELGGNASPQETQSFAASLLPLEAGHAKAAITSTSTIGQERSSTSYDKFEEDEPLDECVADAIRTLSDSNFHDLRVDNSTELGMKTNDFTVLSPKQRSKRLLRTLTSWTKLEPAQALSYNRQQPVISIRDGSAVSGYALLSIRQTVMQNGSATSFQQILEWLTNQRDFFSAASVALDLLRDAESLRLLWRSFDKIEDDDERAKLEGLLDGIHPICASVSAENTSCTYERALPHLSNMAVSLLIHGGRVCSSTLEHFLETNIHYDASRACMMLAAASACAISDDETSDDSVMGDNCKKSDQTKFNDALWPLHCLFRIAVTRDTLSTAILLLDVMIPDELRHRSRGGGSVAPLDKFLALMQLVLCSSPDAAEILLSLTDEHTGMLYWQSLDQETRLALSLLQVKKEHIMLQQPEVRTWVVKSLQMEMTNAENEDHCNIPTDWIYSLARACMVNAGCNTDIMSSEKYKALSCSTSDVLALHGLIIHETRNSLCSVEECVGLDFDVFISALLLLQHRNGIESGVPVQTLVNAACYLAGRPSSQEPRFMLDLPALARQCALVHNIQAGANLTGGDDGLTLECCDILMREFGFAMEVAEELLLAESLQFPEMSSSSSMPKRFELDESLYHLLWLLEQHVLCIRTYGEFNDISIRGRVDPVVAATICLRTWWCLTRNDLEHATPWLVDWLRERLDMGGDNGTGDTPSPHRLACAALIRALLWPSDKNNSDSENVPVLATMLDMPMPFIIRLTQSCCGLYEALPLYQVDQVWKDKQSSSSSPGNSVLPEDANPVIMSFDRSLDNDEDSFVSAVSSIEAEDW